MTDTDTHTHIKSVTETHSSKSPQDWLVDVNHNRKHTLVCRRFFRELQEKKKKTWGREKKYANFLYTTLKPHFQMDAEGHLSWALRDVMFDWPKENSWAGFRSNKISTFHCHASWIAVVGHCALWTSLLVGEVLDLGGSVRLLVSPCVLLGCRKKMLMTHGCFAQKCSIPLVMHMEKSIWAGQR